MSPSLSALDVCHGGAIDAIVGRNNPMHARICADGQNLFIGETCHSMLCADKSNVSSLCFSVGDIVSISAKEKMLKRSAWRRIAAMKNMHPIRDGAALFNPCPSMHFIQLPVEPKNAVAIFRTIPSPQRAASFIRRRRIMGEPLRQRPMTRDVKSFSGCHSRQSLSPVVVGQGRGDVCASLGSSPYSTAGVASKIGGFGSTLSVTATVGFLVVPNCSGVPTGVPAGGNGSLVVDSANNRIYFYSSGAWRNAGP